MNVASNAGTTVCFLDRLSGRMLRLRVRLTRVWPAIARPKRLVLGGTALLWIVASAAGLGVIFNYAGTPGAASLAPDHWPPQSALSPADDRCTLVLAIHPQCPCSRATIGELATIMTHARDRLQTYVLMTKPAGMPGGWERTDLWSTTERMDGVHVLVDAEGKEARLFGAGTSGAAALYHADGRLLFKGGITASRGHFGESAGGVAIIALAEGQQSAVRETSVYGCEIFDSASPTPACCTTPVAAVPKEGKS